jgi:LytS/YehU family sensor histidine kinase
MVQELAAFLRHSLDGDPTQQVTLDQELAALDLYLGIEAVRFADRLKVEKDIAADCRLALVPGLLLQPLVENAIKYAVSPQEEGARISLSAQLVGQRLRLTVSDTGPGLRAAAPRATLPAAMAGAGNTVSTGVGLANIRDRLAQAYGDAHLFEIRTPPEGGFTVVIEVPHEREAPADHPAGEPKKPAAPPTVTAAPEQRPMGLDA